MKDKPILGLAPMMEALGIEQAVSFNDCYALLGELFAVTRCSPKVAELSGNEWCALVNLALARHKGPNVFSTTSGDFQRCKNANPSGM